FGESNGRELGAVIRKEMGHADLAANGSNVHDSPPAALNHRREYSQRGVHRAPEDDVHGLAEVFAALRLKRPYGDGSGVVDENVDSAKMLPGNADQMFNLLGLTYVAGDGADLRARSFYQLPGPHQLVLVAGAQDQLAALLSKLLGQGQAEPA